MEGATWVSNALPAKFFVEMRKVRCAQRKRSTELRQRGSWNTLLYRAYRPRIESGCLYVLRGGTKMCSSPDSFDFPIS